MNKEMVVVFRLKKPGSSIKVDSYLEITTLDRIDLSSVERLGKMAGADIDYYIENESIGKIDLSNREFIK